MYITSDNPYRHKIINFSIQNIITNITNEFFFAQDRICTKFNCSFCKSQV